MPESEKFDICFDARMIEHSGIGRYIKSVLPFLAETYRIAVVIHPRHVHYVPKNAKAIECTFGVYSLSEQLQLSERIPECKVFWTPHFNLPMRRPKADKLVVTIHDTFHLSHSNKVSAIKRPALKRMYRNAVKHADKIFTVSEFSKGEIERHLSKYLSTEIEVISNSFSPDILKINDAIDLPHVEKEFILFVGNQRRNKNLRQLLYSYQNLNESLRERFNLVLVGRKNQRLEQELKAEGFAGIKLTGFVDDQQLMNYYQKAALLVMPSTYEGYGYPILEALGFGTPVLCSDIPPFKEHFSTYASFFDPSIEGDLDRALRERLEVFNNDRVKIDLVSHYQTFKLSYLRSLGIILPHAP